MTTVRTSYSELTKYVVDAAVKLSLNSEVDGALAIITVKVSNSIDATLSYSYDSTVEKRTETEVTREITREFNVGADSIGELYRLVYSGPGVSYESDVISTDKNRTFDKVLINCRVREIPLLSNIKVVYTDQNVDMPNDALTETSGGSPDVNKGYSGKYVWLVPEWVADKVTQKNFSELSSTVPNPIIIFNNQDDAATGIRFVSQNEKNEAYRDLARGSGGRFRYLKMLHQPTSHTRIKRVGLLRSIRSEYIYGDRERYGWDECTSDINENRGGDWLHVCWNTIVI